jgi:hypothetical protein
VGGVAAGALWGITGRVGAVRTSFRSGPARGRGADDSPIPNRPEADGS